MASRENTLAQRHPHTCFLLRYPCTFFINHYSCSSCKNQPAICNTSYFTDVPLLMCCIQRADARRPIPICCVIDTSSYSSISIQSGLPTNVLEGFVNAKK